AVSDFCTPNQVNESRTAAMVVRSRWAAVVVVGFVVVSVRASARSRRLMLMGVPHGCGESNRVGISGSTAPDGDDDPGAIAVAITGGDGVGREWLASVAGKHVVPRVLDRGGQ